MSVKNVYPFLNYAYTQFRVYINFKKSVQKVAEICYLSLSVKSDLENSPTFVAPGLTKIRKKSIGFEYFSDLSFIIINFINLNNYIHIFN